jgi:DNA polymerase I
MPELAQLQKQFRAGVWMVDFEFQTLPRGELVIPECMVAKEFFSQRIIRQWFTPGEVYKCPIPSGRDSLFVAYSAQAELGCYLQLGWTMPENILDLFAEFANKISGNERFPKRSLEHCLDAHKLSRTYAGDKTAMQNRMAKGFPFTKAEMAEGLIYCESDVIALEKLLPLMLPEIELVYALFRGRYTKAVAKMEAVGYPVDAPTYRLLVKHRARMKLDLLADYEAVHGPSPYRLVKQKGVIRPQFNQKLLVGYLRERNLAEVWGRTKLQQRLQLDNRYMEKMAEHHPAIRPLAALKKNIDDLRAFGLMVGRDGRARYPVKPFEAVTSRNYPSASQFLYCQSSWTRALIKPKRGEAVAYVDWSACEFAVMAALSKDENMVADYLSGDPYTTFALRTGLAPEGTTKDSVGVARQVWKRWLLAAQYDVRGDTLVESLPFELLKTLPFPEAMAQDFLRKHRERYRHYWKWTEWHLGKFYDEERAETVFGWGHNICAKLSAGEIRRQAINFPAQANAAECLRWAIIFATEDRISVLCPVHDAVLIGGPPNRIVELAERMQRHMERASELVLGMKMRTDKKITKWPQRVAIGDPAKQAVWNTMMARLAKLEKARKGAV